MVRRHHHSASKRTGLARRVLGNGCFPRLGSLCVGTFLPTHPPTVRPHFFYLYDFEG